MRAGDASIPTNRPTNAIVRGGPFRFSRNPVYVAMLLLQVGVGIWANSLWFLGLAAISAESHLNLVFLLQQSFSSL